MRLARLDCESREVELDTSDLQSVIDAVSDHNMIMLDAISHVVPSTATTMARSMRVGDETEVQTAFDIMNACFDAVRDNLRVLNDHD